MSRKWYLHVAAAAVLSSPPAATQPPRPAGEWPMFGGSPSRNMVNLRDHLTVPRVEPGQEPKALWKADLGGWRKMCLTQPVVATGRVYIGTNNYPHRNPRDSKADEW